MDEDVNKAIKQLETIAIKAMNSGYLDDAAKVMHIAEEIERVDKSGLVSDMPATGCELADSDQSEIVNDVAAESDADQATNVNPATEAALEPDRVANSGGGEAEAPYELNAPETVDAAETIDAPETVDAPIRENVVSLNKLRMKRGASLMQKSKGTPTS